MSNSLCAPPASVGPSLVDRVFVRDFLSRWEAGRELRELDRIAAAPTTTDDAGRPVQMGWQVSARYGRFLYQIVKSFRPRRILEIGMANGVSSAYLAHAQLSYLQADAAHVIIDPFQSSQWRNAGRALLARLGLDANVQVIEDFSFAAVPELERRGERFDLAFIDGNHCLDYTLSDVLVCDRVLEPHGLIVLDDSTAFGVRMAVPYLDRYRKNLARVRFDGPLVHWLREHAFKRRRMTVYQKIAEDTRGAGGI